MREEEEGRMEGRGRTDTQAGKRESHQSGRKEGNQGARWSSSVKPALCALGFGFGVS